MKKFKIVFNLITVAFTAGLLVMITVAWYAVNKTANVTGGLGSIGDIDEIIDTVEYYKFDSKYTSNSNEIYRVSSYVYTSFGSNPDRYQYNFTYDNDKKITARTQTGISFNMSPYDYLSRDLTKYLIKITLKPGKGYSNLRFQSTASYFIGFTSSADSNGVVEEVDNLSMSSVIKFGCYSSNYPTIQAKSEYDNAEVVLNSQPTYSHFEYTNGGKEYYGAITGPMQTIATGATPANQNDQLELYILVDYNLDALNAFYSYNMENHWGEGAAPQFITKDFTIFILG